MINFIGTILDGTYKIDRELGRGGMGTVYLAQHLGTERAVAVKIVSPQFMQRPEFVERFRREAKAAGRLRHPNVVDVTDFGFSETPFGQVAYLVMEYLDGCTLGEILDEEKNLPVAWSLNILEQVCSAVHEAHGQGIIHRDLKPDNIWLEPNQRGSYTVKVLDFGIAKLEAEDIDHEIERHADDIERAEPVPTVQIGGADTIAGDGPSTMLLGNDTIAGADQTAILERDQDNEADSKRTQMMTPTDDGDQESVGTRLITDVHTNSGRNSTDSLRSLTSTETTGANLTKVGAVLGTPLYMSPEQCKGEKLTPASDIYSLGVIAYQMLSGSTPFSGDYRDVMNDHINTPPPPLAVKGVRRKMRSLIGDALRKDASERPQTAEAFAGVLHAHSEGVVSLLQRAIILYTENFTKYLGITTIFSIPIIITTTIFIVLSFLYASYDEAPIWLQLSYGVNVVFMTLTAALATYLTVGTTTWIVSQRLAIPLRPVTIRDALKQTKKRWKPLVGTGILTSVLSLVIAALTCGIGLLVTSVLWVLVSPALMMENVQGWAAIKRSTALVRRALLTTIATVLLMFMIPMLTSAAISAIVGLVSTVVSRSSVVTTDGDKTSIAVGGEQEESIKINLGNDPGQKIVINKPTGKTPGERPKLTAAQKLRHVLLETAIQLFWVPLQILVSSFISILAALLYLKTREAGGEPMKDLLEKFEDSDGPKTKWQERVKNRLLQSGRTASKQ